MKASALALVLLVAPGCSAEADAPAPPVEVAVAMPERPAGPVLDAANIIPPEAEASLDRRLRDNLDRNRASLVVATVDSLGGETIERYTLRLAREWKIGHGETHRGLLLLAAPNDRRVRIEVSCALEDVITDKFAGRVIREHITPLFREGALDAGTLAGVDALIEQFDASPKAGPLSDSCRSLLRKAA